MSERPNGNVIARIWHSFWQSRPGALTWKIAIGLTGVLLVLAGVALLPLPGPGWLVIIAGLGVLAIEFAWAQGLLNRVKAFVAHWTQWVSRQHVALRLAIGLAGLLLACCAVAVSLSVVGVPPWAPEWVHRAVSLLPW